MVRRGTARDGRAIGRRRVVEARPVFFHGSPVSQTSCSFPPQAKPNERRWRETHLFLVLGLLGSYSIPAYGLGKSKGSACFDVNMHLSSWPQASTTTA